MNDVPISMRQLRSLVVEEGDGAGRLELSIVDSPTPVPADHEVLVHVEAAPINPSDLGLLLSAADVSKATRVAGVTSAPVPAGAMAGLRARIGESMPVGNEGCGTVVAAGSSPEAQALLGTRVAIVGGATYAEYRTVAAFMCMPLPAGTTPEQGASAFVNPLTALGMVETMRMEGHTALVHTAAASNLGQMLNRICLADGVPLVNIVRRPQQADLLREQGAVHVVDSSAATFLEDLTQALIDTKATIAFDAIGGGRQVGQILDCMERAINASATTYSRYGSDVHKQVYIYGSLDKGPTEFHRTFGLAFGITGWLLTPFLGRIGLEGMARLRGRVADELTTTFASTYTHQVSLDEVLDPVHIGVYAQQATGQKYLIRPDR